MIYLTISLMMKMNKKLRDLELSQRKGKTEGYQMNEEKFQEFKKLAFENYVDIDDQFKKKSGWNMDKLEPLLKEQNITVDEFIAYAKKFH